MIQALLRRLRRNSDLKVLVQERVHVSRVMVFHQLFPVMGAFDPKVDDITFIQPFAQLGFEEFPHIKRRQAPTIIVLMEPVQYDERDFAAWDLRVPQRVSTLNCSSERLHRITPYNDAVSLLFDVPHNNNIFIRNVNVY